MKTNTNRLVEVGHSQLGNISTGFPVFPADVHKVVLPVAQVFALHLQKVNVMKTNTMRLVEVGHSQLGYISASFQVCSPCLPV